MNDKQISPYSELMPRSLQEKVEMAKYLAQSNLMPGGLKTPAQVLVALQMGHELGLSPMVAVNNIAVINGRPSLSSSIMDAIVMNRPDYAGRSIKFDGQGDTRSCTVTVRRKIGENVETYEGYFDMKMAKQAGLLEKDNWKHYPDRMLKARASSYADRDAWPDALSGMMSSDEAESLAPEPRDVTPQKAPESVKKGGIDAMMPAEELEAMLSPDERAQIDEKMQHVEKLIADNEKYLTEEIVTFARGKSRGNCLRQYYRLGKEPTRYLEDLMNKMREQIAAAKEKEKDRQKQAGAENRAAPAGQETPEVTASANAGWEDAEVEEEPKGELDIF